MADDSMDPPKQNFTREEMELLNALGLTDYFPEKISLELVQKRSSSKLESLNDIPWYFLTKMLMLDYRGRDDIASLMLSDNASGISESDTGDESQSDDENTYQSVPHPMDVVVAVLWCCSNFLRQIVCDNMFMCKHGIPLVLPSFGGQECKLILFALHNIDLQSRNNDGVVVEGSVVNLPIPVVSCVRFGEISQSKSKFLNEILNDQSHPTFHHSDCEGGMNKRILSEGRMEIAWSLRSRDRDQNEEYLRINGQRPLSYIFHNSDIALLNLRGDANDHQDIINFVSQISDVVLAMVDVSEIKTQAILKKIDLIVTHNVKLFIILTKEQHVNLTPEIRKNIKEFTKGAKAIGFRTDSVIYSFNTSDDKNAKHLSKETKEKVSKYLDEKFAKSLPKSLQERSESFDVCVDENVPSCSFGKVKASMELIKNKTEFRRTTILPLQGKPWEEWSRLSREELRSKNVGNETTFMKELNLEKTKQRKQQISLIRNPSKFFHQFMQNLLEFQGEKKLYYLRWLKLLLNNESKEILPRLRYELSQKWNTICELETKFNETTLKESLNLESSSESWESIEQLKRELSDLQKEISESLIGLKHFLRECSQVYEVFKEEGKHFSQTEKERILRLSKIMAELMFQGYPLEILDGDAGGVPLHWIKSVFEELQKVIGNKKVFVISVLGMRSSGKSTLLNAMFGLQFDKAIGKCTHGVYAQLIPISTEYSNENFDYILVVDTEGLRSAELGDENPLHNNEIATFIVGMGDITLVNIKGENASEIIDILQITVHALLKMKLGNRDLKLQPSCIIIHQNVSAMNSAFKLRHRQQKLIETLDKITCVAGKEENAPQYTKFSHIINFDVSQSFFYFPDLREGDPPMGPTNPGYSDNVNTIKQLILSDAIQKRSMYLTIEHLGVKIKELWKGIVNKDFVFSFRNNVEKGNQNSVPLQENIISKCGLENLGNTCFINSCIQLLFHMEESMDMLDNNELEENTVSVSLRSLFLSMKHRNLINPVDFFETIKCKLPEFSDGEEHDAHEFLVKLLTTLQDENHNSDISHDCMDKWKDIHTKLALVDKIRENNSRWNRYFLILEKQTVTCKTCGDTSSSQYQSSCHRSVDVPEGTCNLQDVILTSVEEDVSASCRECSEQWKSMKTEIKATSKYILIHLKRSNIRDGNAIKIQSCVNLNSVHLHIDNKEFNYKVKGVVVHNGDISSGHYTFCLQDATGWTKFNDATISRISQPENAYVILLELKSET